MLEGTPIHQYLGCSTFADHTVMPQIALTKATSPTALLWETPIWAATFLFKAHLPCPKIV